MLTCKSVLLLLFVLFCFLATCTYLFFSSVVLFNLCILLLFIDLLDYVADDDHVPVYRERERDLSCACDWLDLFTSKIVNFLGREGDNQVAHIILSHHVFIESVCAFLRERVHANMHLCARGLTFIITVLSCCVVF